MHLRTGSLPKSPLGHACAYLRSHWDSLMAHCEHGPSELDTNKVENAIRPNKLGHPDAGQRGAAICSLTESCRRRDIAPFTYIRDILARLPIMNSKSDFSVLLPANWKPVA